MVYRLSNSGCIVCGHEDDLTDEHLPPEGLFPESARNDLFVVNACRNCNKSWEKEDEYFRDVLVDVLAMRASSNALDEMRATIARAELHRQRLGLHPKLYDVVPARIDHFIPIGPGEALVFGPQRFEWNPARLSATLCRMVVALHWRHTGARLPSKFEVAGEEIHPDDADRRELIASWLAAQQVKSLGNGILRYAYETDPNDSRISFWAFLFYDEAFFLGSTVTPGGGTFYSPILKVEFTVKPIPGLTKVQYKLGPSGS
jgi:hypothetical protein